MEHHPDFFNKPDKLPGGRMEKKGENLKCDLGAKG